MTRNEVQAVIDAMRHKATCAAEVLGHPDLDVADRSRFTGRHAVYLETADMLAGALEKSEAPRSRPARVELQITPDRATAMGIRFGSAWGIEPREMAEAGPGLWRAIALVGWYGNYLLLVEQVIL